MDFLAKVRAFGERSPFSDSRRLRRRNHSAVFSRARYAHSASFRFSAFTVCFFACNLLIMNGLCVKVSPCKRVLKVLCNDLVHSVLRVKARGCAFRLAAFTLRAAASRGNLLRRFCRMPHCSQAASR